MYTTYPYVHSLIYFHTVCMKTFAGIAMIFVEIDTFLNLRQGLLNLGV